MWKAPEKKVGQIVKEQDLWMINDKEELQKICQRVVDSHPEEVKPDIHSSQKLSLSLNTKKKPVQNNPCTNVCK